ncbi:MAG: hypothetical protein HYV59_09835 [Planctomycetes bacterium]|nr:hypothetical protein [Planctomycetota bacterium]
MQQKRVCFPLVFMLMISFFVVVSAFTGRLSWADEITAFSDDFESGAQPEWSSTSVSTTPASERKFLGRFTNNTVSLSLSGLPSHSNITIELDLFIIHSWDGNPWNWGPDIWGIDINGSTTLKKTTFSNGYGPGQAYPGDYTNSSTYDSNSARTGAVENNTLGYGSGGWGDSVYHLSFTSSHSDSSVAFNFFGQNLQAVSDESWGLDNVVVKIEPVSTAVTLSSFSAEAGGDGSVTLTWETATEIDNAGFNLYRSRLKDGNYKKINGELISATGSETAGASYSYEDTPPASGTYYYKLEDVDTNGASAMHGPVKVKVRSEGSEARRR